MKRVELIAVVLAVIGPSAAARANVGNDIPLNARLLAARGRAAYDLGDYGAAAVAFENAFALAPSPPLLFDLAQAYRLSGNCVLAGAYYRRYLETNPTQDARVLAERHAAAMEHCVAKTDGASATVAVSPSPAVAAAEAPRDVPASHANLERDVGVGLGIGGGVALVAALSYAVAAADASDAVSEAYEHGGSGAAIARLDASGREDAKRGAIAGVTGVAAIGAGAILYYLGYRDSARHALAVVPHTNGMEVHVAWRF